MDVRFHLPVLSECDAECKLCGPLGCLRPNRLTYPEFLRELDRALLSCAETVVFPPNLLNHPEAAQFCAEVSRKGMTPLVRLRPTQLAPCRHMLSELEFRGAKFEVCIVEPLTHFEMPVDFKTIFLPSRAYDPSLLYDSLPFAWRKDLEVLADPSLISADALNVFMSERKLRPYADTTRPMRGESPGATSREHVFGKRNDAVRLSVILTDASVERLDALNAQSLEREMYEVIAIGAPTDDLISWCATHSLSVTFIELPERWGAHVSRLSESYANGAMAARGLRFIFVEPGFPLERDFLMRSTEWTQSLVKIESRSSDDPVKCALMITAAEYFSQGGFALAHDGFAFDFALWKKPGVVWVLGDVDKEGVKAIAPKMTSERAQSARDFYFATLDRTVFAHNFDVMGSRTKLRRAMRILTSLKITHVLTKKVSTLIGRVRAARLQSELRTQLQRGRA